MSQPIVSIDADILVYRTGFAAQQDRLRVDTANQERLYFKNMTEAKKELGKDFEYCCTVTKQFKADPIANCLHSVKLQINKIQGATGAGTTRLYLTGKGNFRERVAKFFPYKGNRLPQKVRDSLIADGKFLHYFNKYKSGGAGKPVHYDAIREYLIDYWDAEVVEGMEADDMMTIRQTRCYDYIERDPNVDSYTQAMRDKMRERHIVATLDKDILQAVGWYYNFVKGEFVYIDEDMADLNLWTQVATGDMTDNIYGIEGRGAKKTRELLAPLTPTERIKQVEEWYHEWFDKMFAKKEPSDLEDVLMSQYTPTEYFEEVYQLIYLLRDEKELARYGT